MAEVQSPKLSPKPYDVIILGASGFTGKYVIREALKSLNAQNSPLKTLALAGRSPSRLSQALNWAQAQINSPVQDIPLLTADTSDPSSLIRIASQARVILNCVGPFRLYGRPVVEACVESGCDYLDITGEPEFMERTEVGFHEKAVEKGSLVVSACGFDSVPAELGFLFHVRKWTEVGGGGGVVNKVDAYLHLESDKRIVGNVGTYESAVLGVANMEKLAQFRQSRPARARLAIRGPRSKGSLVEHQKELGLWAVKLPSADSTVVRRTLITLAENPKGLPGVHETPEHVEKRESFWSSVKPAHFGVRFGTKALLGLLPVILLGIIIGLLGKFSFGRWLLLKFPSFFSFGVFRKEGPTEEQVNSASFKMWFVGHGYSDGSNLASQGNNSKPDTEVITRVMGPEIGYVTTPIILVQCALVLLDDRDNLPKGGVYTPGIVFGPTNLQERLQENGISFDFVSKKEL